MEVVEEVLHHRWQVLQQVGVQARLADQKYRLEEVQTARAAGTMTELVPMGAGDKQETKDISDQDVAQRL